MGISRVSRSVAKIECETEIRILLDLAADKNPNNRVRVAREIGDIELQELKHVHIKILRDLARDPVSEVRVAADQSIRRKSNQISNDMLSILTDDSKTV